MRAQSSRPSMRRSRPKSMPRRKKRSPAPRRPPSASINTCTPEDSIMARKINYTQAIIEALDEELARDPTVFYMGEDIGIGGVFGFARGLQKKHGAKRVF